VVSCNNITSYVSPSHNVYGCPLAPIVGLARASWPSLHSSGIVRLALASQEKESSCRNSLYVQVAGNLGEWILKKMQQGGCGGGDKAYHTRVSSYSEVLLPT
jgi:hypothetical protein